MSVRLIATDEELRIIFLALLSKYKERAKAGQGVIFLPSKFFLPEEKIDIENFSFESEEADIDTEESLRMLGVTLYHLVTGKSELTHESFLLDGYRRPLNLNLWPIIKLLLKKEEQNLDKIEEMIKAIVPKETKKTIDPLDTTKASGSDKTKPTDDILRWLTSEGMKVIDHTRAANFWGIPVPQDVPIRYSEETLREAIAANRNGEQWRLAYYCGLSLRQMRDKVGTDRNNQPCFYNNDWWLKSKEDYWATKTLEPGYYLLNYNGKFASKKWNDQERLLSGLGPLYERAHEFVVGETILSNFNIHNRERLLENWYHWGKESDSGGSRVFIGRFDSHGLRVNRYSPGRSLGLLRVVVFRKFDF